MIYCIRISKQHGLLAWTKPVRTDYYMTIFFYVVSKNSLFLSKTLGCWDACLSGTQLLFRLFWGWHKYERPKEAHFCQCDEEKKIPWVIKMRNFLEIMTYLKILTYLEIWETIRIIRSSKLWLLKKMRNVLNILTQAYHH